MSTRHKPLNKEEIGRPFADPATAGPILTPAQLADLAGLSVKTIYEWIAKGRLDGASANAANMCSFGATGQFISSLTERSGFNDR